MKYVALIYTDPERRWAATPEDVQAMYAEYGRFVQDAQRRGKLVDGSELEAASTATTVRVRNDETLVTDGPFAETKEQLGGFFVLDCDDLDEAIELAARIPGARGGAIEVRPIIVRDEAGRPIRQEVSS
jgi:hypothetical protein